MGNGDILPIKKLKEFTDNLLICSENAVTLKVQRRFLMILAKKVNIKSKGALQNTEYSSKIVEDFGILY